MELREYQKKIVQSVFDYLYEKKGNPCVVAPTGSGKSLLIAEICRQSLENWPDTKILILTHQKELIEQDARTLKRLWEDAEIGIYSAGIGQKCLDMPITYASIQSIYKVTSIPHWNVVLIDECHLINNEDKGIYRRFLERCNCRVIGFTATPYRLGQGMVVEEGSIFTDLIEGISIRELQQQGYLATLRSKGTATALNVANVMVRGGEFVESDLQNKVDVFTTNEAICDEIIKTARKMDRHHWVIFCTGKKHSEHIASILRDKGIKAISITSDNTKDEREEILYRFTHGEFEALVNARLLTTGFDYPDIDLIAMLQPTLSPGLYVQEAGRGLRLKSNGGDCLLLDFAGNVMRHGPITDVNPPRKKGESEKLGAAPMKECPKCLEILPMSTRVCPICGYEFPKNDQLWQLFDGDVNGGGVVAYSVQSWLWMIKPSRKTGIDMIVADYVIHASFGRQVTEYYCVNHPGWAGENSKVQLMRLAKRVGVNPAQDTFEDLINLIAVKDPPAYVLVGEDNKTGKKYKRIVRKIWKDEYEELMKEKKAQKEMSNETKQCLLS